MTWLLKSPCGRKYKITTEAVVEDYKLFLIQTDGLTEQEAAKQAAEHCDPWVWFAEQFSWADVEAFGELVGRASEQDVINALNFYRSYAGTGPANDAEEM